MAWIKAKVNWTKDDYYNFGDLNRVENNTEYLKDEFLSIGYRPSITLVVKNRDNTRFEFYDDLTRVESNILALKNASYQPLEWIIPKVNWQDLDAFDYNDANRLEKNLVELKATMELIEASLPRCGSLICGTEYGLGFGLSRVIYEDEWLLNDDLTQQPLKKYVFKSDGVFDFSKTFKF